jgi:ribose 5-phosphate isomerase B
VIASDHRGFALKQSLIKCSELIDYSMTDLGPENVCISVDYPDYAKMMAESIINTSQCFGILICNSGVGMTIAANRFKGIRAVWCDKEEIAALSRQHNDANIICFGSRFVNSELAIKCIKAFAANKPLSDERHERRIKKIDANFDETLKSIS